MQSDRHQSVRTLATAEIAAEKAAVLYADKPQDRFQSVVRSEVRHSSEPETKPTPEPAVRSARSDASEVDQFVEPTESAKQPIEQPVV